MRNIPLPRAARKNKRRCIGTTSQRVSYLLYLGKLARLNGNSGTFYIVASRNELDIGLQVETFFLEALEEVKQNIVDGRHELYRRAVAEYNLRVREASRNKTIFPKLRY